MPRNGIAGSMVVVVLVFLRTLHTDFHRGYSNLYSHQQCNRVPILISIVVGFIDDSHFDWGERKAQCGFDLHFLYG
jgi:hypothetical protein